MTITLTRALSLITVFVAACGVAPAKTGDPHVVVVAGAPADPASPHAPKPCDGSLSGDLDAEHAEGMRIAEICLVGASAETTAAVRGVLRLRPDAKLTAGALLSDLAAAYSTGRLEQVEAAARKEGPGVARLILTLKERPRVAAVRLEGGGSLDGNAVVGSFPKAGDPLDMSKVFAAERKLKEEYTVGGWDEASVTHEVGLEGDGRAHLTIKIAPGVRAKVGKVTFDGAKGGREGALRKAVELEAGGPLGGPQLERAALLVNSFYYDNGFMNVRVELPRRVRAADGTTAITFAVTEGPVFKIGTLRLRGVDAASEKDLLAKLKTKPGDVFSRSKVIEDRDTIRALYQARGEQVGVEPETRLDPKKGIVDVVVAITR